ncbi:MAG: hypothetical protein ABIK28_14200, partial [Planctomycetota bacterium]
QALYHFMVILGFNYALVLWIQLMNRLMMGQTLFSMILLTLFYPALLYGLLRWLARDVLTGSICIYCLLSLLLFTCILPDQTGVICILFPAACFGTAYILSALKHEEHRKIAVSRGEDPRVIDEELETYRRTDRQIERKFRSKRENSRWYRHPWYSR